MTNPPLDDAILDEWGVEAQEIFDQHLAGQDTQEDQNVCDNQAARILDLISALRQRDQQNAQILREAEMMREEISHLRGALEFYALGKIGPIYDDETRSTFKIYEQYGAASIGDVGLKAKEALDWKPEKHFYSGLTHNWPTGPGAAGTGGDGSGPEGKVE